MRQGKEVDWNMSYSLFLEESRLLEQHFNAPHAGKFLRRELEK